MIRMRPPSLRSIGCMSIDGTPNIQNGENFSRGASCPRFILTGATDFGNPVIVNLTIQPACGKAVIANPTRTIDC